MLKIYNTLSRKKEVLKPRKTKKINLFVCGPTTYDFSHLGHARTYICFDIITKYLKETGYKVFYLQNITDIDDKIINRAKEKKIKPLVLARKFEKEYLKDMKAINVNSVTKYARATEHIKEIISQVKRLLKKGFAYKIKDGIYYDISKFKDYGKLSRRTAAGAESAVSRIDESKGKRNKGDFCLWKYAKKGEPKWKSIFGPGRPGWHIEDTAITEKYFGSQYDIHGGARDLIFPHHEAEISQMEAISGKKPMVKYWLHTGFLTVKSQKMAKSLGNFITIRDFLKEHPDDGVRILRFFVLKSHYRSPINYSEKIIKQSIKDLEKIDEFIEKLKAAAGGQSSKLIKDLVSRTQKEFEKAMADDFNTPKTIALIFKLINKGNVLLAQDKISSTDAKNILKFLRKIDKVFNFIFPKTFKKKKTPKKILELIKKREKLRVQKKWKEADKLRKEIQKLGYKIEDTKKGTKFKKIQDY